MPTSSEESRPKIADRIPFPRERVPNLGETRNSGDTIPIQENWVASPNSGIRPIGNFGSRLHRERRWLIRTLESSFPLAIGSAARVHRRCGNPRCGCRDGAGHPQVLFLSKAGSKRRCQLVRRADEKIILVQNWFEELKRLVPTGKK